MGARASRLRKLMHVALAWLAVIGWLVSYQAELGLAVVLVILSLVVERARRQWGWVNRLLWRVLPTVFREWETRRVLGSTWYAVGALLALLAFGRDAGSTAILFLAWGDTAAEIVGRWWHHHHAPKASPTSSLPATHHRAKTVAGSAGCLLACLAAAGIGMQLGGLSPWAAAAGAITATVTERWSPPPDDNLWIPVLSGLVMAAIQLVL